MISSTDNRLPANQPATSAVSAGSAPGAIAEIASTVVPVTGPAAAPEADRHSSRMKQEDLEHCRLALNNGSKSFLAASHLLPTQMRNAATALYAFCREADDLVDLGSDQELALSMVTDRIEKVFGNDELALPADRALRCVVQHYGLPKTLLSALIEGFAWDASGRQYETLAEVEDYASRVAGTVGAMMSLLMGARDPSVVARACDLGVAMQLTNICRDVGEDARAGRCYLPVDWLAEAGVTPQNILAAESAHGVSQVVERLLARAAVLYQRADSGLAMLPSNCQRGIRMARHLYAAIGDEIANAGYNILDHRAYVPARRKLRLLARHWYMRSSYQRELLMLPALPSTMWLVEAVKEAEPPRPVEIYHGLLKQSQSTGEELITVLRVIDRLENVRRNELQAGSGKVPFGFAGVVRQ